MSEAAAGVANLRIHEGDRVLLLFFFFFKELEQIVLRPEEKSPDHGIKKRPANKGQRTRD